MSACGSSQAPSEPAQLALGVAALAIERGEAAGFSTLAVLTPFDVGLRDGFASLHPSDARTPNAVR